MVPAQCAQRELSPGVTSPHRQEPGGMWLCLWWVGSGGDQEARGSALCVAEVQPRWNVNRGLV